MHLLRRLAPRLELRDGAALIMRGHRVADRVRLGPNTVHAVVFHADGTYTDCGVSPNLLTTDGRDHIADTLGGRLGNATGSPATATSATSLTVTGTPLTVDALKGRRIRTGADVYGNVGANTTSVVTVDQWWTVADGVAATPASTAAFTIDPGGAPARFIALTENATAPAAGDTALTGEITTGGCARALGTYAHTDNAATYTLTKSFSVTATFPAIAKAGLFTAGTLTAGGVMVFETLLNANASVVSGDTLSVTWTVTLS